MAKARRPWMVSLHGGHSSQYCDHAHSTLPQMLEAAVAAGYHTFGVTEHAPRLGEHFLYEEEHRRGWTVETLEQIFADYTRAIEELAFGFSRDLVVLRGFEIEVVPTDRWVELMRQYRASFRCDYVVGSVHFVRERQIDGPMEDFTLAVEAAGGLEELALRYYETLADMVERFEPEVVGHLDLIKKNGHRLGAVDTPKVRRYVEEVLDVVRARDAILDLNTAGYRKGLGEPYPAPWIITLAHRMGIGLCFGDDSHSTDQVGEGIGRTRRLLEQLDVPTVTVLTRDDGGALVKRVVPLAD